MNLLVRGLYVVDPLADVDSEGTDIWIRDGRVVSVARRLQAGDATVVDLSSRGRSPLVACPGLIDMHAHLRQPGEEAKETVLSGAAAAAAGGFAQVVAMANTLPPADGPERVAQARERGSHAPVRVLPVAAVTRGLRGEQLVDMPACAAAGAAAFSDDGRNAAPPPLLELALRSAEDADRAVLVHPEDEAMIRAANPRTYGVTRGAERPVEAEVRAVRAAIDALAHAGRGRLHLQHLSAAASVALVRRAKEAGLAVTAEVTPHHLALWLPFEQEPTPPALLKVNPPLRAEADREALVVGLREGVIDAVATDHAPHTAADKAGAYADAAPGMTGLETALATCLTFGAMGGEWIPLLVERLTAGPWRILGPSSGLRPPTLVPGEPATLTIFDPEAEWIVGDGAQHSRSRNNPLWGTWLRGRVLLTMVEGRVVHLEEATPFARALREVAAGAAG